MKDLTRPLGAAGAPLLVFLALLLLAAAPLSFAGPAQADPTDDQAAAEEQLTRKEQKQRAKQARIEEYLRKREERRARREARVAERERERTDRAAAETAAAAVPPAEQAVAPQGKVKRKRAARVRDSGPVLPRQLVRAQETVRASTLGQDPTVQNYLDLIDQAEASPHQLAAFGNFLAQNGMHELALEYYAVALSIEQNDPVLWLNVGTLHRQLQQLSPAAAAYTRALSLDPNNASAHYNLGAVFDTLGRYDDAIEEYRIALSLDPTLGDPAYNPQAANNERLLAVKLMIYEEQLGSAGLPLLDVGVTEEEPPVEEYEE